MASKLLDDIENALNLAKNITSLNPNDFLGDIRNRYTLRFIIVEVIEAMTSLGLNILRVCFNTSAESYLEVFRKLVECKVISHETGRNMERLARLRNLIVHRYWEIDDFRIYREAREGGLDNMKMFVEEVKRYVSRA